MDRTQMVVTVLLCLFGSGGIAVWVLNRMAKVSDDRSQTAKDIKEIRKTLDKLQDGLSLGLENDVVIFNALRTHEINGESEAQEKKMEKYFISLLSKKEK